MFILSNKNNTPALERAHNIFVALLCSPWPLGISDLARELDLGKSTVHGLVHTLVNLGLLEMAGENGRGVRPASTVLSLWREALLKGALAESSEPLLASFSERHGLTTLAGVFLHARVLIVKAVRAPGFGISAYAGQLVPAWAGALGKILAAALPPARVRQLASRMAAKGPVPPRAYLQEIEAVRSSGVSYDRGEYIVGVRALAALVRPDGPFQPLGAVWAVGLAPSLDDGRLEALGPELKALAEEIGRRAAEWGRKNNEFKN
ncbi:MAG: IclR family transcriptional regulator [Pseudomonadota bacterium]